MSTCDCPTAPLLSGPGFANLDKPASGVVLVEIDWCSNIPAGSAIEFSSWSVAPDTLIPFTVAPQSNEGTKTRALLSGGSGGQVYRVIASITTTAAPAGPSQAFQFTLWVYVLQDNTPAVFVPCEEL